MGGPPAPAMEYGPFPVEVWISIIDLFTRNLQAEIFDDFERIGHFGALSRNGPYIRWRAQLVNDARMTAKARQDDIFSFFKDLSRISKYYGSYPSQLLLRTFCVSLAQQPADIIFRSQRLRHITSYVSIIHDNHKYPRDEELDLVCQGLISLTELQELDLGKLYGPQSSRLDSKILQRLVRNGIGLLPNLRHFIWCNINNEPPSVALLDFLSAHPRIRSIALLNYTPRTRLMDDPWTIQSCPFTDRVVSDKTFLPCLESFYGNILIGTRLCQERTTMCRLKCTATRADRREWDNLRAFPSIQVQYSSSTGFVFTPSMEVENAQLRLVHPAVRAIARCEFASEEADEFLSILESFQNLREISIRATLYYLSSNSRRDLVLRMTAACPSIREVRFTDLAAVHRYIMTGRARWNLETKMYSGWKDVEWAEWAFYRDPDAKDVRR